MTLIEAYKQKMKNVVLNVYNNQINPEFLDKFLDNICKPAESKKVTIVGRNLYKYIDKQTYDANEILNIIEKNHLNIIANGLYTENFDPPSSIIIDEWMTTRQNLKKVELEALEAGDLEKHREYKNKETKVKQNTNSIYGASTMQNSFVSNVDIGGAITSQARNFISEMQWNIEKYISQNLAFNDISEIFSWIESLNKKISKITDKELNYLTYVPTKEDCLQRYIEVTRDVPNIRKNSQQIMKTVFLMFENMPSVKRILFYYACNPVELIRLNPRIRVIMEDLITNGIEFINPYKIPDELKSDIDTLTHLLDIFTFVDTCTYERVNKYLTHKKRCCILSDTDSTMPTMYKIVKDTLSACGKSELIENELVTTKLVMFYVSVITVVLDRACMKFATDCNSQIEGRKFRLFMKNEFFFSIILLFPVKKNYIGIQKLDEGKVVPPEKQLAITGRSLGGSALNSYVSEALDKLIEEKVLKADHYDPLEILRGVNKIRNHIYEAILNGDKTFGTYARYNGIAHIKDPDRSTAARASIVWNLIYPEDQIVPGDPIYEFSTSLLTEKDLDKIPDKYNNIKETLREKLFRNTVLGMDFGRFGLKTFAMPADGDHQKIPEWIIPFINIEEMIEKHIQPIIALYPNLLLSPGKYIAGGTKKFGSSNLIKF